jgi:hypothetical protein
MASTEKLGLPDADTGYWMLDVEDPGPPQAARRRRAEFKMDHPVSRIQ